jgi:hypothetical protein
MRRISRRASGSDSRDTGMVRPLTSRYSDFDGYWVLGLIVEDLEAIDVDLMTEDGSPQASA